jgi:thymidine kinase
MSNTDITDENELRMTKHIYNFINDRSINEHTTEEMSHIELVLCLGPMFSGKTTLLYKSIIAIQSYNSTIHECEHETPFIVINHSYDTREGTNVISSHNPDISGNVECIKTSLLQSEPVDTAIKKNIFHSEKRNKLIILIDECQFFTDIYEFIRLLFNSELYINTKILVCCFGLNSSYMRDNMGNTYKLIPYAKDIIIMNALCVYCGCRAYCSYLKQDTDVSNNSNIIIGGSDKYLALCHSCYKDCNKNKLINKSI